MFALVHTAPFRLEYQEVPDPEPAPDEVLIRVQRCGICGSDVHGYTGRTGRRVPPIIMGHEAAGVVAGVGSAVSGWAEGDRVCFDSTIFCNACEACQKGAYNRCTKRQVLGVSVPGMRRDGAFAEYVTVPAWSVAPLAAHLSFDEATLFEPLSIALHAVHRGAVASDEVVLILGCGTIGLLAIAAARQRGAGRILATDVRPERLQRARSLGADEVVDVSQTTLQDALREIGAAVDVVIEAVGFAATIREACGAARPGGRVVLLGNLERDVTLDVPAIISQELTLVGSYASAGEFRDAVRLVTERQIDVRPLISEIRPLQDGQSAFDRLHQGEEDLVKIILAP